MALSPEYAPGRVLVLVLGCILKEFYLDICATYLLTVSHAQVQPSSQSDPDGHSPVGILQGCLKKPLLRLLPL